MLTRFSLYVSSLILLQFAQSLSLLWLRESINDVHPVSLCLLVAVIHAGAFLAISVNWPL